MSGYRPRRVRDQQAWQKLVGLQTLALWWLLFIGLLVRAFLL